MPPVVAAAAITGLATAGTSALASRSQSRANQRALESSERGAKRAEAFEREQDRLQREDDMRREDEERRRFDIDQRNIAAERSERDQRQQYEDMLRYRRMVNIAMLTGQPPPPPPTFGARAPQPQAPQAPSQGVPLRALARRPVFSESAMRRPIVGDADPMFDPLADQRMPLSRLSGTR